MAGVCQGLAQQFGIETWILRTMWIISICWFGAGLFIYFILSICLPREDRMEFALQRRILGVCSLLAIRYDFDIGLVRFLAVIFAMSSLGASVFVYIVLYFVIPKSTGIETRSSTWQGHGGLQ